MRGLQAAEHYDDSEQQHRTKWKLDMSRWQETEGI